MGQDAHDIKGKILETKGKIAETVTSMTESIADGVSSSQDKIAASAGDLREKVDGALGTLGNTASSVRDSIAETLPYNADGKRNPLPLIVGSAAVAVAAGFLLPLSDWEKERLQPLGDDIVRRGYQAGQEIVEQSQAVIAETVLAAKTSFDTHSHEAAVHLGIADDDAPKRDEHAIVGA